MKYYRCYLLAADGHIATAEILKCADDSDAERQCLDVFSGTRFCASAEVWDGARQVYRHPEPLAAESERRDEADANDERWAMADASDAQGAADCRVTLDADAVKAAQRRERRLESAATTMSGGERWKFDRRH
jgi:hypothetical protein